MNFDGAKICGVADHFGGGECQWPFADVSVYAEGMLGDVNLPNAVEQAIEGWNRVCGINLSLTANPRTAHVAITRGHIDGPSGTLGWSQLPCGFTEQRWDTLIQKYDTGEVWTIADNPPAGKIDAVRVICHEIGHAIGISHIQGANLMAPTYSAQVRWPRDGDIKEAVWRYGKRRDVSPPVRPPVDPTQPGADDLGVWGRLLPCLLKYGVDIFASLDAEERRALLKTLLGMWRKLNVEERRELQRLVDGDS